MGFPPNVENDALVACGRRCCICHKFCGTKIELHHIKQKAYGGEDTIENCIPLCLECHAEMGKADPKHPKGKHYNEKELIMHRDNWYKQVKNLQADMHQAEISSSDKELFKKICETINPDTQYYLHKADLIDPIPETIIEPLEFMIYEGKNPLNEFINYDLEMLRADFLGKLEDFIDFLAYNTFNEIIGGKKYQVTHFWLLEQGIIPRGDEDYNEYYNKYYKTFRMEGETLNAKAYEAWESFCEFVRQGRRIIGE